jgi:alpha-glucosidase (family GH31 glycosyl hydrolase)
MLQPGKVRSVKVTGNDIVFDCENDAILTLSFPEASILRMRLSKVRNPRPSIMVLLGYVKEVLEETRFTLSEEGEVYSISTDKLTVTVGKQDLKIKCFDKQNNCFFKTGGSDPVKIGNGSLLSFTMSPDEHFYGFGFQRKTLDARGYKLTFTRNYRWQEATTPYFLSSKGYGFFSANTFDQTFDFTGDENYSIYAKGGHVDFFIFLGPSFKDIIDKYTALTGRPVMVPKWSMGVCYITRCFENDKGLLDIARRFRKEGIPCDMVGLEPGWEEHWYSMDWIWNSERFPDPEKMIRELNDMGYKLELWESGTAPTEGYLDPEVREKWFLKRVDASINKGVSFYKQDDPYPRCITTTEMVLDPDVSIFVKDTGKYTEEETKNITNTLYTKTLFDGFRRMTGKRTIVMLHAYNSSTSSQMYPTAWAGDFKLGNGALNASLSGHAMVSQDMDNESPEGIHFGFLTPFSIIDSWAYYREPWLYSKANEDITRFYSRLKSSLFPYLYTTLWQSHTKGIPMLRPMMLEYQYDKNTASLDKQFMFGDYLLIGTSFAETLKDVNNKNVRTENKNATSVYLPKGTWINYWSGEHIESDGRWQDASWPETVGGPLFVKAGAIIAMTAAKDSLSLGGQEMMILDCYPKGNTYTEIYEDDGESFEYENGKYALTQVQCEDKDNEVAIRIGEAAGEYVGKPDRKACLIKIHMDKMPEKVMSGKTNLQICENINSILNAFEAGWSYDSSMHILTVKPQNCWKLHNEQTDLLSFYNAEIDWKADTKDCQITELLITKGHTDRIYGTTPYQVELTSRYPVLLADGESKTTVTASLKDAEGLPVKADAVKITFKVSGQGRFGNGLCNAEVYTVNGRAETDIYSAETPGTAKVEVFSDGLSGSSTDIAVVIGTFDVVINPPKRIRLSLGSKWLPYYIYTYAQIRYDGQIIRSAKSKVSIKITGNEERDIDRSFTAEAKGGTARFSGIVLGKPAEPPDVVLHFDAKGVTPYELRYNLT